MSDNEVRCPHGIACDYVHRTTTIEGETYVVGGDYWHTPDEKCPALDEAVIRIEGSDVAALRAILATGPTAVALGYNANGSLFMVAQ